jgi:hypothetical protein
VEEIWKHPTFRLLHGYCWLLLANNCEQKNTEEMFEKLEVVPEKKYT